MKINLTVFILFLIVAKSFLWMLTIPLFQGPDENSHFAYIQRLVELSKPVNKRNEALTSSELVQAAEILKFNWGEEHPVWQGYQANWRQKLEKIPFQARQKFIFIGNNQRALKSPPLYYYLSSNFYKLFYSSSFICRFFALRFFSFLLSLAIVLLVYKISFLIFMRKSAALTVTSMVAFQPMFSFQSGSINNDVLAILIGTLFIYLGVKAMKEKRAKLYFLAFLVILCGLFVKPQLLLFLFAFPLISGKFFLRNALIVILVFLMVILIGWFAFDINKIISADISPFWDQIRYKIAFNDYKNQFLFLFSQFREGIFIAKIAEYFSANKETYLNNLFPWYWGVFGWLESTMPLLAYRILKVVCILSGFGLIIWFIKNFKNRAKNHFQIIIFLFWSTIIFSLGIIFNDFKVFSTTGQAFGIQGRYFLPVISAYMILLFLGIKTLVGEKSEKWLYPSLIFSSITLNIIGFWTMYCYFWS